MKIDEFLSLEKMSSCESMKKIRFLKQQCSKLTVSEIKKLKNHVFFPTRFIFAQKRISSHLSVDKQPRNGKKEFLQQTYYKEPAGQQNSRIIGFYFISPAGCPNCLYTYVPTRCSSKHVSNNRVPKKHMPNNHVPNYHVPNKHVPHNCVPVFPV